ncbi:hypothetical protein U1E44_00510 [Arenibacter sp. GZD96]|uniref:hypothetical protein n=1 Tax=Aurantibrevibacter litoralis TaxID=3106030 RepID=UPI002AFE4920|nr:hypothetical protein [Arenibacter sp. GZD-96]MEA1784560.1 hypothetical protein [Arenibacter sp. GZD-96]
MVKSFVCFYCFVTIVVTINAQRFQRDTLYFNLEGEYIYESIYVPNTFLLMDSNDIGSGTFFFEKEESVYGLSPKKPISLKKYVRSSNFYDKRKGRKLYDEGLFHHFEQFVIFLVLDIDGTKEYIRVAPGWAIE